MQHVTGTVQCKVIFLVHLSQRLKCTIVITCCPSSVRPSLTFTFSTSPLKPLNKIQQNLTGCKNSTSSTKFVFFGSIGKTRWPPWPLIGWDIFDFSSETAERNSTKLDRKQDLNVLYQVCVFRADRKKQDGRPGLWLAETFSTSPLKLLNRIQRNLTGSKISTSSTKFVFFGPIGKTRWPPWPLIRWDIFDFSSETAERNSTKLDRKQDLNVLYQVCVFRADRKNKMAALVSDWLRLFLLLLWNLWSEFNETWQEARSQRPLPSLCFSGRSENKNVHLGRFLKKVAHCTQVHDMWPFGPLVYLGIEFYLFVSHGSMNDRGSTCKFGNARSAFWNLHVDPLSFIPPWEINK